MSKIYANISEAVNNVRFGVKVPDTYAPVVPGYYKKYPNRQPLFTENQPFSKSKMTCADIVDMCNNNIQFVITRREDVETIVGMITRYANDLQKMAEGMPETSNPAVHLGRCNIALNILRQHHTRAVNERKGVERDNNGQTLQSLLELSKWM